MAALKPDDHPGDKPDDPQLQDKLLTRLLTDALYAPALRSTAATPAPVTPALPVSQSMPVTPTIDDAVCPDIETMAAYSDRNLATEEIAQLDIHFADCARCQQILAALALSTDESPFPKVALEPAPISFPRPVPIPTQPTRWRWLAPAAGIAAAVALWFVLRPAPLPQSLGSRQSAKNDTPTAQTPAAQPGAQDSAANNSEIAEANIPSPPSPPVSPLASLPAAATATPAPAAAAAAPTQEPRQLDALKKAEPGNETPAVAAGAGPAAPPPRGAPAPQSLQAERSFAPARTPKTETVTVTGDLPQVNTAKTQLGESLEPPMIEDLPLEARNYPYLLSAPPGQIGTTQELRAASSAPVFRSGTAPSPGGLGAGSGGAAGLAARPQALAQTALPPSITFASPGGSVVWRIGAAGSIERSSDRGRTWQRQSSGVTGNLLAGAAASDQAAWIVGRGGIILRTTDGANWQRVSLPSALAAPLTAASTVNDALDLSAVRTSDAQHATITATGGRHFTTQDGGTTWTAQ